MSVLMIISPKNRPVYEATIPPNSLGERQLVLSQLVISAALDVIDETMWTTKDLYLKVVDKFNEQSVSAFITAGSYRFVLLHDGRHEDGVKTFFTELYEYFVKVTLNPFYDDGEPIRSRPFHERVTFLARKYL